MDHQVGAQLEGPLQGRRAEAVVDCEQRSPVPGDLRQGRNIENFSQRVGRRLEEQQARVRLHRGAPCRRLSAVRVCRLDSELGKDGAEQLHGRAEDSGGAHDVISAF